MEQPEPVTPAEQSFEAFFEAENKAEREPAAIPEIPVIEKPVAEPETAEKEPVAAKTDADADKGERNADGTFKPKDKKPRNDPQARIDQQTAKQRDAERRAEAAERRVAELEASIRQPRPRVEAPPAAPESPQDEWKRYMALPGAPQREAFTDPAEWAVAANYHIQKTRDAERAHYEQQALGQHLDRQRSDAFRERAVAKDPKFFETLQARIMTEGDPPINRPVQDYIKASPLGPDLLVYLLDNPADAQRLSTLPPLESREAIAEIAGSLKARQTAASQAPRPAPVLSRAPAPIQPLGGSLTPADTASEDVSFEEHVRRENANERAQRR